MGYTVAVGVPPVGPCRFERPLLMGEDVPICASTGASISETKVVLRGASDVKPSDSRDGRPGTGIIWNSVGGASLRVTARRAQVKACHC